MSKEVGNIQENVVEGCVNVVLCVNALTEQNECVYVVGNNAKLGSWNYLDAVPLTCDNYSITNTTTWNAEVELHVVEGIEYRYFIARRAECQGGKQLINIVRWEAGKDPRTITKEQCRSDTSEIVTETFGSYGNNNTVLPGWLTDQSEVVIQLYNNPIEWYSTKIVHTNIHVKCSLIDTTEKTSESCPFSSDVSISVLRDREYEQKKQNCYGTQYKRDDVMMFTCQTLHPHNVVLRIDFLTSFDYKKGLELIGHAFVMPPDDTVDSHGKNIWPITDVNNIPVGKVKVDCVVIRPVKGLHMKMDQCYQKYWNKDRIIKMGHRGLGQEVINNQKSPHIENSISSFASTTGHGLCFVEMDVILSKDMIPVIYHDYHIEISCRQKSKNQEKVIHRLPVKEFDLKSLQSMAIFHPSTKETHNDGESYGIADTIHDQPFPTLQQCFEHVDENIGFNIEVKYPLELETGEWEETHYPCRNKYYDILLKVVFKHAGNRRVIFSCFDPNTCHYLKVKQNRYPVVFLSMGEQNEWTPYKDPRAQNTTIAKLFALSMDLLGIAMYADHFINDPSLAKQVTDNGLVLITWGGKNNIQENVETQAGYGVQSFIIDKWYMDAVSGGSNS